MIATTKESFFKKINRKENGCWDYTGCISQYGYGLIGFNGKIYQAHRLSFMLKIGDIPKGMMVCHTCDNRKCVNPEHLFLGIAKDNTKDMIVKGRHRKRSKSSFCKNGHLLSAENVYVKSNGNRTCKICTLERERKYRTK